MKKKPPGVLIVDDDLLVLRVVCEAMQDLACSIFAFERGLDAVRYLQENTEDIRVAVLDLSMPGMTGEETLEAMLAINPDLHIILISGTDVEAEENKWLCKGAASILQKPFRAETLSGMIASLLSGNSAVPRQ